MATQNINSNFSSPTEALEARRVRPLPASPSVSRRMQKARTRDTAPEMALRSALHRLGLRFRVDRAPLSGVRRRADIVFTRAKVAVFVDGCFWHGCPIHGTRPKNNAEWWREKIEANRRRDRETDALLRQAGWQVYRAWEHEGVGPIAHQIASAVKARVTTR